jgi:hypothetical protein
MVAIWKPVILGRFPQKVNSDLTAVDASWQATLRSFNQLAPFQSPDSGGDYRNRKAVEIFPSRQVLVRVFAPRSFFPNYPGNLSRRPSD